MGCCARRHDGTFTPTTRGSKATTAKSPRTWTSSSQPGVEVGTDECGMRRVGDVEDTHPGAHRPDERVVVHGTVRVAARLELDVRPDESAHVRHVPMFFAERGAIPGVLTSSHGIGTLCAGSIGSSVCASGTGPSRASESRATNETFFSELSSTAERCLSPRRWRPADRGLRGSFLSMGATVVPLARRQASRPIYAYVWSPRPLESERSAARGMARAWAPTGKECECGAIGASPDSRSERGLETLGQAPGVGSALGRLPVQRRPG